MPDINDHRNVDAVPVSDTATITMSVHDYRKINRAFQALRDEVAAAQDAAPVAAADDAELAGALGKALEIVAFAVANLPPESVAGWPVSALLDLGAFLRAHGHEDLGQTFAEFADMCADVEGQRVARRHAAAVIMAASASPESGAE